MSFMVLLILCLALWSCGGGGSSGGGAFQPETALTETNAPQAAAGLLKATDIIGPLQGIAGTLVVSSATTAAASLKTPVSNLLNLAVTAAKDQKQKLDASKENASLPLPYTMDCPDGGTLTVQSATWDGPAEPASLAEIENFSGRVSFNNCQKGPLSLDGSMNIAAEGFANAPTAVTLTATMTYNDSYTDTTLTLSGLSVAVSNIGPKIDMGNVTIAMSGSLEGVLGEESIDISCDNFVMQFTAFTEGEATTGITGELLSVSGRIKTSCLNTWLTITTITPIRMVKGYLCPTAGEITFASQDNTIRVVIGGDSGLDGDIGIDYTIDLYFNDELIATYANCTELKGLCSSTN